MVTFALLSPSPVAHHLCVVAAARSLLEDVRVGAVDEHDVQLVLPAVLFEALLPEAVDDDVLLVRWVAQLVANEQNIRTRVTWRECGQTTEGVVRGVARPQFKKYREHRRSESLKKTSTSNG